MTKIGNAVLAAVLVLVLISPVLISPVLISPVLISPVLISPVLISPVLAEEPVDAATKSAIQDVIKKQLDAFAHDDAKTAQSFATPALREKFSEPDKFFAMVKKNYAPLVHPKSVQFGNVTSSPHGPLQTMTVVSDDGTVWTAIYSMQKVDGNWRISGCGLQKEEGQQAI